MKPLSIGEVAHRAGVGIETIRFYEREGLVAEPPRKESGYRQYPEDAVFRIRFIKRAKELGFSLKEIKELLSLRIDPRTSCAKVQERAEAKVRDIEEKIQTLQRMKKVLAKLAAACPGEGPISECPILDALQQSFPNQNPTAQVRKASTEKRRENRSSRRATASRPVEKGGNHVPVLPR